MLANATLALLLTASLPQGSSSQSADQMNAQVATLGEGSSFEDLEKLDQFGCAVVPSLVGSLRTVAAKELFPDVQSKYPEALHVVWVIAALRYITGQEFTGSMSSPDLKHYSENARYFLRLLAPKGQARFFSDWPSRGTLYFSPIKTQQNVIDQWRAFMRSGHCRPSAWAGRKEATFWFGGIVP